MLQFSGQKAIFVKTNFSVEQTRKWWHWLILLILSLTWGSSFILMKRGLESFSSMEVGSFRLFISFLCLLPLALRHLKKLNRLTLTSVLIIGFIGNALPAVMFPLAQTRIDSATAGMLNSLTPVFTLLLGILIYRRKAGLNQFAGIILGFIGAIGLLYKGELEFNTYGLIIVLATTFYGISSNQVTRIKNMNGAVITSLAFFFVGPFAGAWLFANHSFSLLAEPEALKNFLYIAILAVMGSAVALMLFNILILHTSPMFGVTVTYLAPIVAAMWGFLDGESITPVMFLSVGVILLGVYLVSLKPARKPVLNHPAQDEKS